MRFISQAAAFVEIISPENVLFTIQNRGIEGRFPNFGELKANYTLYSGKIIATVCEFAVSDAGSISIEQPQRQAA